MMDKSDFYVRQDAFCLSDPINSLRILVGAGFIPHALSKFADGGINPATLGFFEAAGYAPANLWVIFAALSELGVGVALILGIATHLSALGAAAILLLALVSLVKVAGFGWYWNTGGVEYLVFWIICCLLVAQHAFKRKNNP